MSRLKILDSGGLNCVYSSSSGSGGTGDARLGRREGKGKELLMIVLAVMCGGDGGVRLFHFGSGRAEWF